MSKKLLRKKLALMLATLKKKRKYYVECEYLESTGTQYINTGVLPANDMEFECKFTFTSLVSSNLTIIGSRDGEKRCQPIGVYNNRWSASIGGSYDANGTSVSANTPYIIKSTITNGQTITTNVNGSQASTCTSTTGQPAQPLYIFARNWNTIDSFVNGKLNFLKIKANGVLVRDFIPVLDWNMRPALYDKVSGQLFYNQGTGSFTYGREIHYVDYLESTGTQYIDTGYIPNINTECSMNLAFVSLDGTYRTPFSVRTADGATNSFTIMSSRSTNDNNSFAFGSSYWSGPSVPKVVLNKTVEAVLRKGYASWDGVSGNPGNSITPTTLTAYMFARNSNGTAGNFFMGKIYSCIIKDNNITVRDYIPAIDENGVGYMFDRVSHTCYLNQGTGAFKYPAREVVYLQSSGTQYIDMGITSKSSMRAKSKFNLANVSAQAIFGSANAISNGVGVFFGTASTGAVYCNNTSNPISPPLTLVANTNYEFDMSLTTVSINDVNYTASTTSDNNYNMLLFARILAGSVDRNISGKIYYFKLYDNGVLVRDFIPCYKDGQAGMLDKANNVFYPNQGTGTFTTGKIIEPEYE